MNPEHIKSFHSLSILILCSVLIDTECVIEGYNYIMCKYIVKCAFCLADNMLGILLDLAE
jgi:hypothetical protein